MTILVPSSKAVSRALSQATWSLARLSGTSIPIRVRNSCDDSRNTPALTSSASWTALRARFYATEAAEPAKRTPRTKSAAPKTRAAKPRTPRAKTASTDAADGTADSSAAAKPKTRSRRKTKTTARKSKTKSKARKAKPKAKPKPKKPLSKTAQAKALKQKTAAQKAEALLRKEPKNLPFTAYQVFIKQSSVKGARNQIEKTAVAWKQQTPEDIEQLNHIASANKAKNDEAYKNWVNQHSPTEIRRANHLRAVLRKTLNGKKRGAYAMIKDDRMVKLPRSAYLEYSIERQKSGDFKSITIAERARLIGREWKEMAAADKKTYEDRAKANKAQYVEEHTAVYGEPPAFVLRTRTRKT